MSLHRAYSLATGLMLLTTAADADVVEASATSMSLRTVVEIHAPAARVYDAFVQIGSWWDKEHTYSGDSANLKLTAATGGCFCETLPDGGGVQHMIVVNVAPNRRLTMAGALGPLQSTGVTGALSLSFVTRPSGMELVMTYNVGGYYPNGMQTVAGSVDDVLTHQMQRLKSFVETGNPDGKPNP